MNVLDGTTIFWLIAMGMLLGALVKMVMWKTTVSIIVNVVFGAFVAVIMGAIFTGLNLPGVLLFSFMCSMALLFILNVFNMETQEAH